MYMYFRDLYLKRRGGDGMRDRMGDGMGDGIVNCRVTWNLLGTLKLPR